MNDVLVGDCFKVLPTLGAESVDLCVTSPPYWGLRDYGNGHRIWGGDPNCDYEWGEVSLIGKNGGVNSISGIGKSQPHFSSSSSSSSSCVKCSAWYGSLGLEPHPQMFIDHLVEFGRLVRDVLKPSGLFWLNLGDTYAANRGYQVKQTKDSKDGNIHGGMSLPLNDKWLQPKQLLMIPSRVACALQDDGWILRSDVIWSKPNHMPESVTDRFTKSYEHFFMFAKEPRYYFNLDEIRQLSTSQPWTTEPGKYKTNNPRANYKGKFRDFDTSKTTSPRARLLDCEQVSFYNPKGKNPGDVWEIPTQPFPGSHFAVFPEALVKRIIKCSSPPDGVVLDPFAGSGTTLRVARKLGRKFIGIELNPEYANMAEQRIRGRDFRLDLAGVEPLLLASKSELK